MQMFRTRHYGYSFSNFLSDIIGDPVCLLWLWVSSDVVDCVSGGLLLNSRSSLGECTSSDHNVESTQQRSNTGGSRFTTLGTDIQFAKFTVLFWSSNFPLQFQTSFFSNLHGNIGTSDHRGLTQEYKATQDVHTDALFKSQSTAVIIPSCPRCINIMVEAK